MAIAHAPPTVLLVDDDDELLLLWRMLFSSAGRFGPIHEAHGGEEALALLLRIRPDVVLTDLRMPRVSGFEVLRAVRTLYPDAVVVATSGAGEVEAEARHHGATVFLPKYESGTPEVTDLVLELLAQRRHAAGHPRAGRQRRS